MTRKRSNFGKNDLKLLQLGFRFRFKLFDIFEGDCFDYDKLSPPPPRSNRSLLNIVKPECNILELLIFWFNHVSLTHTTSAFSSAYTRKRWSLGTDCQFIVLLCDNFLASHHEAIDLTSSRSRNRSMVSIGVTRHQ